VPALTYPSSWFAVAVTNPVSVLIETCGTAYDAVGIALIVTELKPSYPVSGVIVCSVVVGVIVLVWSGAAVVIASIAGAIWDGV